MLPIPERIILLYHANCNRAHWTITEARKCAGHYLHFDKVKQAIYVLSTEDKNETFGFFRN